MAIPPTLPPSSGKKSEKIAEERSLIPPDTLPQTLRSGNPIDPVLSLSALTSLNFPATQKPSEDEINQCISDPKTGPSIGATAIANAAPLIGLI